MLVFFWFRTSLSQLECGSGPKCSKHPTETQVKMFKSPIPPSIVHYGPKKHWSSSTGSVGRRLCRCSLDLMTHWSFMDFLCGFWQLHSSIFLASGVFQTPRSEMVQFLQFSSNVVKSSNFGRLSSTSIINPLGLAYMAYTHCTDSLYMG